MSDTILHSILNMDIAQRHSRYLQASARIVELERERDEARGEVEKCHRYIAELENLMDSEGLKLAREKA